MEAAHAFIEAWFRGTTGASSSNFEGGLAARLAPGFVNVQPSGLALSRAALLASIREAHGSNPDFRIEIAECALRWSAPDASAALATYAEHQRGARNTTPADNTRVSTLLLTLDRERPLWLHLQETARHGAAQ